MEKRYMINHQKHFANLNDMRLTGHLCDVSIKVNGKEFLAHKNVLAASLKFFKLMFLNNDSQEIKQTVVVMDNMKEAYLELILVYVYTGQLLLTERNVFGLLDAANHLGEDNIKKECIDFIGKHPEISDACQASRSFMIVGTADNKLKMQLYDFTKHEWCKPCEIMDLNQLKIDKWIAFWNQFYYTVYEIKESNTTITNLQVFNPLNKQNTMLASERRLLRDSAMCACTEIIYFCGGRPADGNGASDQVLKYDLRTNGKTNVFETLPPMRKKRADAAAVFYQGYLLVLGGYDEDQEILNSVEKYDPVTKQWLDFPSMLKPRDCFGIALVDGKLYACGGNWYNSVEVYDPSVNSWHLVTKISGDTCYPLIIGYEDKLLHITNDGNQTFRVYDPCKNRWLVDQKMSSGLELRNFGGGLVPSSCSN